VFLGAFLVAGAAQAQVSPTPPPPPVTPPPLVPAPPSINPAEPKSAPSDTARKDSTADSLKVKKDSIEAPFAQAPSPELLDIGESFTWDRAQLFNTGALTLVDVLNRIPGLTVFQSGWIASPQYVAYLGNPARVRIFYDGAEIMAIGNSVSYPLDLATVPIWPVQQMTVERGADELRVYLNTWTVTRTTTQSRIDIVTGDLGTNMLRGYFGTRFQNGMGVQFGGQVFGTINNVAIGGGSGNDLMLRVGWAKYGWSIDGFIERALATRDPQIASGIPIYDYPGQLANGIPGENGNRTFSYVRAGFGRPDSGRWYAQIMGNQQQVSQLLTSSLTTGYFPTDSARTFQSVTQLIGAAGVTLGPTQLSGSARYKWLPLGTSTEYTGRGQFGTKFLSLSVFADYVTDSGGITDLAARINPTSFLAFEGAIGYRSATAAQGGDGVSGRVTAGVRLGRVWIQAGAMQRDATVVPGLVAYDTAYKSASAAAATGGMISVRGKVVEDVGVNAWVVRWNTPGWYRPQVQARGEVFLDTDWLSRFPSGHFGFKGAFGAMYRTDVLFPTQAAAEVIDPAQVIAVHSAVLYTNVEVRILDATLYFTANWALTPRPYELVPQYVQQAQVFTYGLRWPFWN
jgi:hypothetical protein